MKAFISVLLFTTSAFCSKISKSRHPRLFWVSSTTSTSTTTSTLSTNSLCYITGTGTFVACTGRKRRFIDFDPLLEEGKPDIRAASPVSMESDYEEFVEEVNSGKDTEAEREARFLLYWMTTTLTSTSTTTSTSFSSTQTLTLTVCTPTTVIATCG